MFKYLVLFFSLVWPLSGYAGDAIFNGGTSSVQCDRGVADIPWLQPLAGRDTLVGEMKLGIIGIELSAGINNPGLIGLTAVGPGFECDRLVGFNRVAQSNLARNLTQKGTLQISRPWFDNEYFDIGGGLAMKIVAGDNPNSQKPVTQEQSTLTTYQDTNAPGVEKLGLYLKATLKVVSKNIQKGKRSVRVGIFRYTLTDLNLRSDIAWAPVVFDIDVSEAQLRTCQLDEKDKTKYLASVKRQDVFVRGDEVYGGEITVGPVICREGGVDVEVSFFDEYGKGYSDHLRTVYSDTGEPSQYALKFYPTEEEGGSPLMFLPRGQMRPGWNAVKNETTVELAKKTTSNQSVSKNYKVNYVRLGDEGDDRAGEIKGIMTVQFLYY